MKQLAWKKGRCARKNNYIFCWYSWEELLNVYGRSTVEHGLSDISWKSHGFVGVALHFFSQISSFFMCKPAKQSYLNEILEIKKFETVLDKRHSISSCRNCQNKTSQGTENGGEPCSTTT